MKTKKLNRARVVVITEALTDYLEHYYEALGEPDDASYLVGDHFKEFVEWAYDDLIISVEERDMLLSGLDWGLIEAIKFRAEHPILTPA